MKTILRLLVAGLLLGAMSAHAAVSYVSKVSAKADKKKSISLAMPTTLQQWDVLLAQIAVNQTTETAGVYYSCASIVAPAGWTLLNCSQDSIKQVAQAIYYKQVTVVANDRGRTYTWQAGTANARWAGGVSIYRGADRVSPIDAWSANVQVVATSTAKTLPATATSVTTTVNGDYVVGLYGVSYDASQKDFSTPAGTTIRYAEHTPGAEDGTSVMMSNALQTLAGATGNKTSNVARKHRAPWVAISHLVAIKASNVFDHLRILHDGLGVTCLPETLTIQACGDSTCSSLYTGAVTANLSPTGAAATWSSNPVAFTNGSTTVSLQHTATGSITLAAPSITPLPSGATKYRCFNGAVETCNMTIATSGFAFDTPNLTACKTSAAVTIRALQASGASCSAAMSGAKTVNFWSTYADPASGGKRVSVNGVQIATASPGTPITLNFDGSGAASFTVNYPDAGSMMINASHSSGSLLIAGADSFVSTPVGVVAYSAPFCAAGDITCPVFAKAGDPFAMTVKAACWQSDTDANLADNAVTPNFQLAGVALSSTVVAPAGGADGLLGVANVDFTAADAGVVTIADQTESEVGVFTFTATPPELGYFGLTIPPATSANVGRFVPHHFALDDASAPTLVNRSDSAMCAASTFTYLGEPFQISFGLQAQAADGGLTSNYDGAFARLDPTQASSFGYGAASGATNLSSRLDLTLGSTGAWSVGVGAFTGVLAVRRSAAPDGPFVATSLGLAPVDPDGVTFDATLFDLDVDVDSIAEHALLGLSDFRYGRLAFRNSVGSELLDLPLPLRVEYFANAASGFMVNSDDFCSTSPLSLTLGNYTSNLNAGETCVLDNGAPGLSGAGCASAGQRFQNPPLLGDFNAILRASGVGNNGSVTVTATAPAWLQFDWNAATPGAENPSGVATFGVFQGDAKRIYQRVK